MSYEKDYKDFGYFVKHLADAHSEGRINDKDFIEILKKELEVVKKGNA